MWYGFTSDETKSEIIMVIISSSIISTCFLAVYDKEFSYLCLTNETRFDNGLTFVKTGIC